MPARGGVLADFLGRGSTAEVECEHGSPAFAPPAPPDCTLVRPRKLHRHVRDCRFGSKFSICPPGGPKRKRLGSWNSESPVTSVRIACGGHSGTVRGSGKWAPSGARTPSNPSVPCHPSAIPEGNEVSCKMAHPVFQSENLEFPAMVGQKLAGHCAVASRAVACRRLRGRDRGERCWRSISTCGGTVVGLPKSAVATREPIASDRTGMLHASTVRSAVGARRRDRFRATVP